MKNKILFMVFALVIVPSVAFASWWNPFTWFSKPKVEPVAVAPVSQPTTSTLPMASLPVVKKTTQKVVTSSDITAWSSALNSRITNYQGVINSLETANSNNSNFISTLQSETSNIQEQPMVYSLIAGGLAYRTANEKILVDLNHTMQDMQNELSVIANKHTVDTVTWNSQKFTDIDNFLTTETNAALQVKSVFDSQLADATDYIHLLTQQSTSSSQPSYAPVSVNTGCATVDQDVRNEISAGNGMANEAQVEALVAQRERQLGCNTSSSNQIPSAVCSDGTTSYSENRSGTCSDHGGVSTWLY